MSQPIPSSSRASAQRFQRSVDVLTQAVGHADHHEPSRLYTTGLLLAGECKSVDPMGTRLNPGSVRQTHQALPHLVADATWSDTAVLAAVREAVLPSFVASAA